MATLKTWRLLRKLRCSTNRITAIVQAVLALHRAAQLEVGKGSVSSFSVATDRVTAASPR